MVVAVSGRTMPNVKFESGPPVVLGVVEVHDANVMFVVGSVYGTAS